MHPQDCPAFEYSDHPDKSRFFPSAVDAVLRLLQGQASPLPLVMDTRPVHAQLFKDLCPAGCEYYAGHYRGEDFRCLRNYRVFIPGDSRVDAPPSRVAHEMRELARLIRSSTAVIEAARNGEEKVFFSVAKACRLFVDFLTIHPYANGNGHIARWLLAAFLRLHGYRLNRFQVDPRPADPPYSQMIYRYRNGEVELLERYVLSRLS